MNKVISIYVCMVTIMIAACGPSLSRLHKDIVEQDTSAALVSIKKGENINEYSEGGYTPLQLAVQSGQTEIVKALIDAGADLNLRTIEGLSPLALAIQNDHIEIAKLLLTNGAVVNKLKRGHSPLFEAVKRGDPELFQLLLDAGGDVNFRDHRNATALYYTAYLGQSDIAKLLIAKGADINALTTDQRTALHVAVYRKKFDIADMLLDAGALIEGTNISEEGVYTSAQLYKYVAIRYIKNNQDNEAKKYLELAVVYFNDAVILFNDKIDSLEGEVLKKNLYSVASVVLAGMSATYQASVSPTGMGSAQYKINNTSDLESLVGLYRLAVVKCNEESELLQEILKCGDSNNAKLLSCYQSSKADG